MLILTPGTADALNEGDYITEKPLIRARTATAHSMPANLHWAPVPILSNCLKCTTGSHWSWWQNGGKGKEPKILIDDKPVELNAQQLRFPGINASSMIERIGNDQSACTICQRTGGELINIITVKVPKVGMGGRLTLTGGTRDWGRYQQQFQLP